MLNAMRKNYVHLLETLEEMALATIARIVPWLIPIGPAFMIKTSVETYLQVDPIISTLMAAGFEGMGIYTSHVAFLCWSWNKTRTKKDGLAPFDLMRWLVGTYLFIGIILVVLIKVYPPATIVAPAFFLPLGLVVYTSWATHIELTGWRNAKEEESQDRKIRTGIKVEIKQLRQTLGELRERLVADLEDAKQQTQNAKVELQTLQNQTQNAKFALAEMAAKQQNTLADGTKSPVLHTSIDVANVGKQAKIKVRQDAVLQLLQDGKTKPEIAKSLGVSVDTVRRDCKSLNGEVTNETQ